MLRHNLRVRVLFLCTGNSCRSQIAEGWLRHRYGGEVEAVSAGSDPAPMINPRAVEVMAEIGVSLAGQFPKSVEAAGAEADVIVTLCGSAADKCSTLRGRLTTEHWGLPDPADATGTSAEVLEVFRASRDDIVRRIDELMARLLAEA